MSVAQTIIRPINRHDEAELKLVAARMRDTLIEVLGEERGGSMYTMEWLITRAAYHLDPNSCTGEIFLSQNGDRVTGHSIVRVEKDEAGKQYGLFSTTYVEPDYRRRGIAQMLIKCGEDWMRSHHLDNAVTYTEPNNEGLKQLFGGMGYASERVNEEFVALKKRL